jgi:hypothetical protein
MSAINEGGRPFPALTPEQRLYLDVNGYVIIPNALSDNEVKELLETIYGIERSYRETGQLPGPNCHLSSDREDYFRIAGTHKISPEVSQEEIVGAAIRDPRMIHHVEAPAGSVLLFFESLIHASGIIESDRDRVLILGGYTPPMFQAWSGYEADPAFAATVSEGDRSLLTGGAKYGWQRHTRELGKAAQTAGEVQ